MRQRRGLEAVGKTPLCAIACHHLLQQTLDEFAAEQGVAAPDGLVTLLLGGAR